MAFGSIAAAARRGTGLNGGNQRCGACGRPLWPPPGPALTVDVIVTLPGKGIVLVRRRNPPLGWALPGGFVDRGETLETAAAREILEETGLRLRDLRQWKAYSDPGRDPRMHTVTMVFTALGEGDPVAGDDAAGIGIFPPDALPEEIAFDHREIIGEYSRLNDR